MVTVAVPFVTGPAVIPTVRLLTTGAIVGREAHVPVSVCLTWVPLPMYAIGLSEVDVAVAPTARNVNVAV